MVGSSSRQALERMKKAIKEAIPFKDDGRSVTLRYSQRCRVDLFSIFVAFHSGLTSHYFSSSKYFPSGLQYLSYLSTLTFFRNFSILQKKNNEVPTAKSLGD